MATNIPFLPSSAAQEGIIAFQHQCYAMQSQTWNIREAMRKIDLAYARENDFSQEHAQARLANRLGDASKFQNVVLPVIMPQVESAVAYQASVFLTGSPLFGVSADPKYEDEALMLQSLISDDSIRGGWAREFLLFFQDGFKYNLSALEVTWESQSTPQFLTDPSIPEAQVKNVIWSGNKVKRIDPYNLIFDARYLPTQISENGEFSGYTEMMSRIQLKKFTIELNGVIGDNLRAAFESGISAPAGAVSQMHGFYTPRINPDAILQWDPRRTTDWMAWAGLSQGNKSQAIQYKNIYEVTTLYGRIVPADFGMRVPQPNTPQIWKFIIVNHSHVILAERQTNAHNLIPILFGQPMEDGLGYQTKSFATNVQPFQEVGTALLNSMIAARRRAIADRTLYDPSRINPAHINSDNPSAKIPVKPAAYGTPLHESVFQFPFRDDLAGMATQEIQMLMGFANQVSGQNQAKQGQFVKGNKTLHEYESVMSNASARDQKTAMLYEAQIFTPLKNILKLNVLQYHTGGEVYSAEAQRQVSIDPVALRKATLNFKMSDGLIPTEKLISTEELGMAFQMLAQAPQIAQGYNIAPMFSYLMKTRNANLSPFEKSPQQLQYEQALAAWQQAAAEAAKAGSPFSTPQPPAPPPPQTSSSQEAPEQPQESPSPLQGIL
jgi:hypothetical protein